MPSFSGTERYAVERVLGEGHFGVVYQCFDRRRGARVALKVLRAIDPASLAQLKAEFRAPSRIVHPNVALLHELESNGSQWFFTMEFVDGTDLTTRLRETPARSPARLAAMRPWMLQLARGVAALHRGDTLHRDLKPSNVLVTREGRVVLVDFGLSIDLHDESDDSLVGSAAYMAPEAAERVLPSPASDWYSFGVVLYNSLTDRLPFEGKSLSVLLDKCRLDAPALRALVPEVPEGLDALCAALLARNPEARPVPEAVIDACAREDWRPVPKSRRLTQPVSLRALSLVGRDAEITRLREALGDVARGECVVVRVTGASGVGKSALIHKFASDVRTEDDITIFEARCYERESVPFKALDGLVDAIVRGLAARPDAEVTALVPQHASALCRLFPALCGLRAVAAAVALAPEVAADPAALRRDAATGFESLLNRLASRGPLVIVLDDLQWGDTDSAALLGEVLRRSASVLLVACDRGDAPSPCRFIDALKAQRISTRDVALRPLGVEHSAALAEALLPDEARRHAAFVARESGGNPFLVGEIARLANEGFALTEASVTLDALWRARFNDLSPSAWLLLVAVSVAAQPLDEALAMQAAELTDPGGAAARQLLAARLLRSTGTGSDALVTWHDRVRDAVVSRLSPESLAAQHRSLAHTLALDGRAEPETLAGHYESGGDLAEARRYFVMAATRAARALAFERAVELYRRALALGDASQQTLRSSLAEALANAGRGPEAAREYLAACEGAEASTALSWRLRAADALIRSGHLGEGMPLLREVMSAVGLEMPGSPAMAIASLTRRRAALWLRGLSYTPTEEARVLPQDLLRLDTCWTVASALGVIDVVRAAEVQALHMKLALEAGEGFRVARSLAVEAASRASAGGSNAPRATELWERASAIAARERNPTAVGITTAMQSLGTWCLGRWTESLALAERADEVLRARCTGVSWELAQTSIVALDSLVYLGRWSAMGPRAEAVLRDARDRGDLYLETVIQVRFSSRDALRRDEVPEAERCLDAVTRWSNPEFDSVRLVHAHERMAVDLYQRAPSRALMVWQQAERAVRGSFLLRVQLFRVVWVTSRATAHVMAAWQQRGEARRAQTSLAKQWISRLAAEDSEWSRANARALSASVAAIEGRGAQSTGMLAEAAAAYEALGMTLHAASAQMQRGALARGPSGESLARAARETFAAAGVRAPERIAQMIVPMGDERSSDEPRRD